MITTAPSGLALANSALVRPKPHGSAPPAKALPKPGHYLLTDDQDLHWLRRFTYGVTAGDLREVAHYSRQKWFAKQLRPGLIHDPAPALVLAHSPLAGASPAVIRAIVSGKNYGEATRQLQTATLARQLYSGRQLFERMVELWWDRLHVSSTVVSGDLLPGRDQIIRQFAMGKFSDLLQASTRDPAMLTMLDAANSRGSKPNENFGRELLELHTVGTGNYTEEDVHNSALVLTGLTIAPDGTPAFNQNRHYVGPVQVMGWSHPNRRSDDGNAVIFDYLSYLAAHPATANQVSVKLARRFVSDNPDRGLVAAMAATYLASQTALVPVLKTMVAHAAFARSVGAKTHGAYSGMLASVRTMRGAPVGADPMQPLLAALLAVGSGPFVWPVIDGPPDDTRSVSAATVLARWNVNQALATGGLYGLTGGLRTAGPGILGVVGKNATAGFVVDRAAATMLHQQLRPEDRKALLSFLGRREDHPLKDRHRLPGLLAMLLDSPYGATR